MTDRTSVERARAAAERLAGDLRRRDLGDTSWMTDGDLTRLRSVREARAFLDRLPDADVARLARALRDQRRRVAMMGPVRVPRGAPIPDRVVDALPFLERERRTSPIVMTVAVVSVVGLIAVMIASTLRGAAMRFPPPRRGRLAGEGIEAPRGGDERPAGDTWVAPMSTTPEPADAAPVPSARLEQADRDPDEDDRTEREPAITGGAE